MKDNPDGHDEIIGSETCVMNSEEEMRVICPVCGRVASSGNYFVAFLDDKRKPIAVLADTSAQCQCSVRLAGIPFLFKSRREAKEVGNQKSSNGVCTGIELFSFAHIFLPALTSRN